MNDVEKDGVDGSNSSLLTDVVFCIKVTRLIWNQFCSHLTINHTSVTNGVCEWQQKIVL